MDENTTFCQSCGMPMQDESLHGSNADLGKNADYCLYCYKEGEFTADVDMEGMIDMCVPIMAESIPGMTEEQASELMHEYLPKLKRWRK